MLLCNFKSFLSLNSSLFGTLAYWNRLKITCKHLLGILIRLKLLNCSLQAKSAQLVIREELVEKKAKSALVFVDYFAEDCCYEEDDDVESSM